MEIKTKYYACMKTITGIVEKKEFDTREEAREYLATHYDDEKYSQYWTE